MTHFLLSPEDADMLTDFDTIKDIIKDDDFGFFLDAYKDVVENFDIYKIITQTIMWKETI